MHDQLADDRRYRLFNVIDNCNRERLGIELNKSRIMQPVGYGRAIMSDPTWVWVVSPRSKKDQGHRQLIESPTLIKTNTS